MTPPPDSSLSAPVARIRAALASVSGGQIALACGYDDSGNPIIHDLATIPHFLIAGSDRAGLPQMLHTMVASVLFKETPDTCRLLLIDPTGLEFGIFADVPHLLSPVTNAPADGMRLLRWLANEMDTRYGQLAAAQTRNIDAYSRRLETDSALPAMPRIICVVSQYENLRLLDEGGFDQVLVRLAQKARATGIHLILGAGDPERIPTLMRANLPSRILLSTGSRAAARGVLGSLPSTPLPRGGEFMLHNKGHTGAAQRAAIVPVDDLEAIVDHWRAQGLPEYLPESVISAALDDDPGPPDGDGLYDRAVSLVYQHRKASVSWLQRELRVGYNTATRLIERMEEHGIVSAPEARGRRKLLAVPGGYDIEITDEPLEIGSKRAGSKVYFRERDFWEQPARRGIIDKKYTVEEILAFIDNSAPVDGEERAAFASALRQGVDQRFPLNREVEQSAVSLPAEAPEIYQGLRGPETPPVFVQRVYGEWLGHGLTKAHIRNLDPVLYTAIHNWLKKPGCEWPSNVDLPTKEEQNTRDLDALRATAADGALNRVLGDFTAREAGRIRSALLRRDK